MRGKVDELKNFECYDKVELGDKRLSARLVKMLKQLSSDPTASILAACKDIYQAKAVYRFTDNDNVTADAITKITHDVTINNIKAANPSIVLIPQDTTEINYCNLEATEGLGTIARRRASKGILAHSAIATDEMGNIFGLVAQKLWVRPPEEHSKAKQRNKLAIEDKESNKWLETIENASKSFPSGITAVHICDREGDIFELFCKAEAEKTNYLCRRWQNRKTADDVHGVLDSFIDALPVAGEITVHIPRCSHSKRKARDAELKIKYGRCQITKPSQLIDTKGLPSAISVYVVSAVEANSPEGQEGVSWQLITNVPTNSFGEAVTRILWYTQRWKIETFHRTLKSGCKVEELRSDTAEKLQKLISIYSIIALEIMHLRYLGRMRPDDSCEISFEEDEWKVLYRVANRTRDLPDEVPTMQEAVMYIAKLGGFPGRKSDGQPGVTVIWRGLSKLNILMEALPFFGIL